MNEDAEKNEAVGGVLIIPDGWVVDGANFDAEEPFITIFKADDWGQKQKLLVPKCLAYYLRTHWCGSQQMHDVIEKHKQQSIARSVRDALGI